MTTRHSSGRLPTSLLDTPRSTPRGTPTRFVHVTIQQGSPTQHPWQAPGAPTTAPAAPALLAGQQHLDYMAAQRQPTHPWDHPTSLQDLDNDAALTRRVAEALQAAAVPFAGSMGKQAHFPHHLITRGPKKQKTGLGELTLPEYAWGFTQLIKSKDPTEEATPYMNLHLEKILEDAITYPWEVIRAWSEEVCSRIALNRLKWSETYVIDRLQTNMAQQLMASGEARKSVLSPKTDTHEMSEEVRRAKPGPPCKFYQTGTCSYPSDHVQNGYRQLHVCTYCISNKCLLQPHSNKDCKTKKFNVQKKGQTDSGFGN